MLKDVVPVGSGLAGDVCHLWEFKDPQRTLRCTGCRRWSAGLRGSGWGGPGAWGTSLYEEPEWSSRSGGTCIHHPAVTTQHTLSPDTWRTTKCVCNHTDSWLEFTSMLTFFCSPLTITESSVNARHRYSSLTWCSQSHCCLYSGVYLKCPGS